MSTSAAQMAANIANAKKSTGPTSQQGKANSSQNNFRHGFRGKFAFVKSEDPEEFKQLFAELSQEHQPQTVTEQILVQSLAEHHWLVRRARHFQNITQSEEMDRANFVREMSLWMRYETQHERAFHKCLSELRKTREERRKNEKHEAALSQQAEKIKNGFERQQVKEPENTRWQEAQAAKQRLMKANGEAIELDTEGKAIIEAPFPGCQTFNFDDLKAAIKEGIRSMATQKSSAA